jgi:hypothetical protein
MGKVGHRWTAGVLVLAVVIATIVVGGGGAGAEAPPPGAVLTPSATHGAPGDTITVDVSGCGGDIDDGYQAAAVRLVTTGPDAAVVAIGESYEDYDVALTLPDWYEPGPAQLVADCFEYHWDGDAPTVLFSFAPVAIDLMAGDGEPRQTMSLSRTSVQEGQVIRVDVGGCEPVGEYTHAYAVVYEGDDAAGAWVFGQPVASGSAEPDEHGTASIELAIVGYRGPIEAGAYIAVVMCEGEQGRTLYRAQEITITGTNPAATTLDATYRHADGEVTIVGEGCVGGELVTLRVYADRWGDEQAQRAQSTRARGLEAQLDRTAATAMSTRAAEEFLVTPDEDGSWSHVWNVPVQGAEYVEFDADCGDPFADGFRYRPASANVSGSDLARVTRVSPTTSPVNGPITVQVTGDCTETVTVEVASYSGEVFSSGTTTLDGRFGSAEVEAPAEADQYAILVRCGRGRGLGTGIQVFDPGSPRSPDPVPPAPPATGWPSAGPVETFIGRVGPIDLPTGHDMPMDADGLPPSGIAVDLPRPEGDFAIRSVEYDLIDADTMTSVPKEDAHLHHFVMADLTDSNPACPSRTFGLPGQIFGAVGQERSQIDFGDPYGYVVQAGDTWAGTYDLMNLGHEDREVYLTYEMTLQRDVSKIRPVTPYFFSATGCDSFTWLIDGSGTKDVQSTYLTMAKDGLLVGGGGHVHNGGEATELYDDRGRRVCRSELHVGEGGHGGHGEMSVAASSRDGVATTMHPTTPSTMEPTTTSMDESPGDWDYPPEFYPDDPSIEHISTCPGINQPVKAGERLRFDAIYTNDRPRSGVMGIGTFHVWEGGGPADPVTGPVVPPGSVPPGSVPPGGKPPTGGPGGPSGPPAVKPAAPPAKPISGKARFTG